MGRRPLCSLDSRRRWIGIWLPHSKSNSIVGQAHRIRSPLEIIKYLCERTGALTTKRAGQLTIDPQTRWAGDTGRDGGCGRGREGGRLAVLTFWTGGNIAAWSRGGAGGV